MREPNRAVEERAAKRYKQHKARLQERYTYARQLGFAPPEASVVSSWSIAHIDEEARSRGLISSNETAP